MPLIAGIERYTEGTTISEAMDDESITTAEDVSQVSFDEYVSELATVSNIHETINEWSPQKSFCAESPYYDAFVEKEMQNLQNLSDFLMEIGNRTTEFAAAGVAMAKAARNLSLSCRLKTTETNNKRSNNSPDADATVEKNRQALGTEMAPVFERVGEVLERIASEQEKMCEIIESAMGNNLQKIASNNVRIANNLKTEADNHTEKAERMFFKYLNGNEAGGNFGESDNSTSSSLSISSNSNFLRSTSYPATRSKSINRFLSFRGIAENAAETVENEDGEPKKMAMAKKLAQWQVNMEEIRVELALAELSRFQLFKYIVSTKHQRPFELCQKTSEAVREMHEYYRMCAELLGCILPCIELSESECKEKQSDHQKNDQPVWLEREGLIIEALTHLKDDVTCAEKELKNSEEIDPSTIDIEDLTIEEREYSTNLWDVFELLASRSQFPRMAPPGVVFEGWLYRRQSGMLQTSWMRHWFMLKEDGIYYLQRSKGILKSSEMAKVKVCDIVLCTVKELQNKPQARFSFELIASGRKPVLLQARGPKEYRKWINAIRAAIGGQLATGDPHSEKLNQNIGIEGSISGEIESTVLVRGDSIHDPNSTSGKDLLRDMSESTTSDISLLHDLHEDDDNHMHMDGGHLVKKALKANPNCADCGIVSPNWVSLNLGILVCLECSGVHRSLGVHVSKVRSLDLDSLNHAEAGLILALGNERMNDIYEKEYSRRHVKPVGFLKERQKREEWIRKKYVKKKYLKKKNKAGDEQEEEEPEEQKIERLSRDLYEAAKTGDVVGAASAIANGADINWQNYEDGGRTALQIASVHKHRFVSPASLRRGLKVCAELLVQNGAKDIDDQQNDMAAAAEVNKSSVIMEEPVEEQPQLHIADDESAQASSVDLLGEQKEKKKKKKKKHSEEKETPSSPRRKSLGAGDAIAPNTPDSARPKRRKSIDGVPDTPGGGSHSRKSSKESRRRSSLSSNSSQTSPSEKSKGKRRANRNSLLKAPSSKSLSSVSSRGKKKRSPKDTAPKSPNGSHKLF